MAGQSAVTCTRWALAIPVLLQLCLPGPAERAWSAPAARERLLVWLEPGASMPRVPLLAPAEVHTRALISRPDRHFRQRGLDRLLVVEVPSSRAAAALAALRDAPGVKSVEADAEIRSLALPNDPALPAQWGLVNSGQTGGTPGADIDWEAAWGLADGSGVVVAVLDTGIDETHPDLLGKLWVNPGEVPGNSVDDDANGFVDDVSGWDFSENDNDPQDGGGHGTHVSGIIGAVADNGVGIAGVSPGVQLMPLKILGSNQAGTVSGAIAAIQYAIAMGADVLSNSWAVSAVWGEPGWDQPGFSPALEAAIDAANAAGIPFVAAAGNSALDLDQELLFPASYQVENVVAVAATDHDDALAPWSNFGANSVHLAAPGDGIHSTVPQSCLIFGAGGPFPCDGSRYLDASGTSMAAPQVAGVMALIKSAFPSLSLAASKARLLYSTEPLPGLAAVTSSGGRLDAAAALAIDSIPPGTITDLSVAARDVSSLTVAWSATGDDGGTGTARAYDVRYSPDPIDSANFDLATALPGVALPSSAGALELANIAGLPPLTPYHVAVRAIDDVGNAGPISNVVVGATLSAAACTDLVAFWSFEEGPGAVVGDASCNANEGSTLGAPIRVQGLVGQAIELDGVDDEVRIADTALSADVPGKAGATTQSFTLSAWVHPDQAVYQMIAAKDAVDGRSFNFAVRDDSLAEAQLFAGSTAIVVSSVPVAIGAWTHVALVFDLVAANATLYVHGVPAGSTALSGSLTSSGAPWTVGARALGPTRPFVGEVDEVAVFDRALDPGEIEALGAPQCGNLLPEVGEECDDGNSAELDGCSADCALTRRVALHGTAAGGSVTLVVDGESVVVQTTPGQGAQSVLGALVVAIASDPTLQSLQSTAVTEDGVLVTTGLVTGLTIADAGLSPTLPVPALAPLGMLAVAALLAALGAGLVARRH